jgi:hypothetical protein
MSLTRQQAAMLRLFCRPKVEGHFNVTDPSLMYGHSRRTALALERRGLFQSLESPEGTRWTATEAGHSWVKDFEKGAKT